LVTVTRCMPFVAHIAPGRPPVPESSQTSLGALVVRDNHFVGIQPAIT
jgi:hypothetical protein